MFVLLFAATQALKLTDFDVFKINLNATAREYFVFQGPVDYSYFYQKNNHFQLWLLQNDSHEIYQAPYSEKLEFEWPNNTINGEAMDLILHEGIIQHPLYFDYETFMTTINSIVVGKQEPVIEKQELIIENCKSFEEWMIYAGVFMVILIIVLFKYKSLLPLIDPLIKYIMQRFLTNQELDVDGRDSNEGVYNTSEL